MFRKVRPISQVRRLVLLVSLFSLLVRLFPGVVSGTYLVGFLYAPQAFFVLLAIFSGFVAVKTPAKGFKCAGIASSVLVMLGLGGLCLGFRRPRQGDLLRVLTVNVEGDDITDVQLVDFISESCADVIFLQEVSYDPQFELCKRARPDLTWVRQALGPGTEQAELAIGTNLPVLQRLAFSAALQPSMGVECLWKGRFVQLVDVHLQKSEKRYFGVLPRPLETDSIQELQATGILDELHGRPTILGGDFNSTAATPAFQLLTHQLTDTLFTAGRGLCYTFPSACPVWRIDDVLTTDGWEPVQAQVLGSMGSDHRPVEVWLQAAKDLGAWKPTVSFI